MAIALVKSRKVKAIVTQNVDGLHSKSGVPDAKLMELHGSPNPTFPLPPPQNTSNWR